MPLEKNPYDHHTGWTDGGQKFGCDNVQNYQLTTVSPKTIIKADAWEALRKALNVEETRRSVTFQNSSSRSNY